MYLTLSKRFEFSSSLRLGLNNHSDSDNAELYGPAAASRFGTGYNLTLYTVFHGEVDRATGMMINVSAIKERVMELLARRYDHKFLNADTPPFDTLPPTPELLVHQLLAEITALFPDTDARPVACHLEISSDAAATAYVSGDVTSERWLDFSAARQTWSPHLSADENRRLFGAAASPHGHGHNYRLRVVMSGSPDSQTGLLASYTNAEQAMGKFRDLVDHKNLNHEVPELAALPMTTERLAQFAFDRLKQKLPVSRVRLYEHPGFFAEYDAADVTTLGLLRSWHSAHRLHSPQLSESENIDMYGKCNNPGGHGHEYRLEATIGGRMDNRSGTLYDLVDFGKGVSAALEPWEFRHLDRETTDFVDSPSTGENIILTLWPRLNQRLSNRLQRLRLWETPNNRFTLRALAPVGQEARMKVGTQS